MTRAVSNPVTLDIRENTFPTWLPAVGTRGNVSLNTLYDTRDATNPDDRLRDGTRPILNAWCSTTYAPNLGRYGSIIAFGGGHADGIVNSVHRYDIDTQTWTRVCDPDPVAVQSNNHATVCDSGENVPPPLGWPTEDLWADAERTGLLAGKLAATHTYCEVAWAPPDVVGNINGWLVIVPYRGWPHYVDFDSPSQGWQRLGGPLLRGAAYGWTIVDRLRKRMMSVGNPSGTGWMERCGFLDLQTLAVTQIPSSMVSGVRVHYMAGFHDETEDLYISHSASHNVRYPETYFWLIDPIAQVPIKPTVTGSAPPLIQPPDGGVGTLEWVPSDRKLVWWSGVDETLWSLAATGSLRTDPWQWSSQDFPGAPIVPRDGNTMFKRLHWVEELGSFFIVTRHIGPVQCWRVR